MAPWTFAAALLLLCSGQSRAFRPVRLAMVTDATHDLQGSKFTITENSRSITLRAAKSAERRVEEVNRPLDDYLRLPASEYSVLDGAQIERLDDEHFRAVMPSLNFFGNPMQPIIYVAVLVEPEVPRARIVVERAELQGGPAAQAANGTFTLSCENVVTMERAAGALDALEEGEEGAEKKGKGWFRRGEKDSKPLLKSDVSLEIIAKVPDESKLPVKAMERLGNAVLQTSFNLVVPRFVGLLSRDFKAWSTDGSRLMG